MERNYIALIEYSFYGTYTETFSFKSRYRANSKANKLDALNAWKRRKEKGISRNSIVLETWLERT